jgi:signal transduction histidine kinase
MGDSVTDTLTILDTLDAEFQRLQERGTRSAPGMLKLVDELRSEIADLRQQGQELASLYEVAQDLAAKSELSDLLESIIDKAIVLVGAERGFVALVGPDGGYYTATARRFGAHDVQETDEAFSSSLVNRVMERREPILTTNIQDDGRFELTQSIIVQRIRSVLAVPLIARGELQGAIYVDTRMSIRPFSEADLRLLQAMASQAAMAIRSARLYDDVRASNAQLNQMVSELRETQAQLVQAERLAAVGRLATSVAHELRNPLMVMRTAVYFLDRVVSEGNVGESGEILKRYFTMIDREIDRQTKIINDLLFFSRNRPRQLADVDLNAILDETLMRVTMPESVEVRRELDAALPTIRADADQLQQVFVNLVTNAVQAMPEGGVLAITSYRDGGDAVALVSDTGVGIPEEDMERLFQPFFTTKDKGIGLGLAVTRSLVEGHRGTISAASQPGHGTTFTVRLPVELVG